MAKRFIEIIDSPQGHPANVGDIIALLAQFPMDRAVSFSPFNLNRIHEELQIVHFEMQESEGTHYKLLENLNG